MRKLTPILLVIAALGSGVDHARAYVELSGLFVADERCQALDSIRRETNPGRVLTVPGQSYHVRGLNREDGDYVQVDVPGAVPRTRWVSVACGELFRRDEEADSRQPEEAEGSASQFLPFFVANGQADEQTPPPPSLDAFDRAVLRVCGGWGSRPSRQSFRGMLDDPAHAAKVDEIYRALDGSIVGPRRDPRQFKDELTAAWFDESGFHHIFCGEPSETTIAGLHFAGRYLQMQERGWGGLDPTCNSTEIVPPVYTFGVRYRARSGRLRTACPKGYALNLDAREIFIEATKALKQMLPRTSGNAMCLHQVQEPNVRAYLAVFVIKNAAVRTFYPDASPTCDRNRPPDSCLCGQ